MKQLLKYIILDILKNKIVIVYTLLLAALSWSAFGLEDQVTKGLLTELHLLLLVVPMVSILFSTIYLYNSSEFMELLLSHPVKRSVLWKALFLGLSLSLSLAFVLGAGLPILLFADTVSGIIMVLAGILLSVIFAALAFLCSIFTPDKAKGIGISILLWLYFSLLFDGLVLFLLFQLADYPIEKMMVGITALNPVDLCRILILLRLDVSAMMGYTGAVFQAYFGSTAGLALSFALLSLWAIIPFHLSLRKFKRKDL